VGDVQAELNAVFNLDRRLGGESPDGDTEPVQISVDGDEGGAAGGEDATSAAGGEAGDDDPADAADQTTEN
jgi:hypothetical protein